MNHYGQQFSVFGGFVFEQHDREDFKPRRRSSNSLLPVVVALIVGTATSVTAVAANKHFQSGSFGPQHIAMFEPAAY
jgi:hypothetical protein